MLYLNHYGGSSLHKYATKEYLTAIKAFYSPYFLLYDSLEPILGT